MLDYERLYAYRFRDIDGTAREQTWGVIAAWVHSAMGEPERMLDPAAGTCEFINASPASERWAVDRVDYGDPAGRGVRFVVGDIFDAELPEGHFDGIFVSNFLEHLPDPDAVGSFLAKMARCAVPGARIAILGPNYRYCSREYWDCADHVLALTHLAIEEHLYAAGFEPERTIPRLLPYSFRGGPPAKPALVRAYLRTPLAWRVLGKQFFVVGRR